MGTGNLEILYDTPPALRAALDRVGQSEDVKFSPNSRLVALPSYDRNAITVLTVDISNGANGPRVTVIDVAELTAPGLDFPHGVDFLDDRTLLVANRLANVTAYRLPAADRVRAGASLEAIAAPPDRWFEPLNSPNSIAVVGSANGEREVLIGHRFLRMLTRHVLQHEDSGALAVTANELLLHEWIAIVDGVAVSPDGAWLALSNPPHHNVLVYERSRSLQADSEPDCILRGGVYPHGLCFSPDGRHLLVADAGSPHVHLFTREGDSWSGVQYAADALRVMDDDRFERGHTNLREGGPKGLDIDATGRVLAVTSRLQPLAFFDAAALIERSVRQPGGGASAVGYELGLVRAAEARHDEQVEALIATRTYRVAERLRRISALRSKLRR
jgi:hypothetical protein